MAEGSDQSPQTYGTDVEKFLKQNEVKDGWRDLILQSEDLTQKLGIIIGKLPSPYTYTPAYDKILNAFSHAEPGDIKVVIIGTSPAATPSIASGLAFSSDRLESTFELPGMAIPKVHQALRDAQILDRNVDYYCGHQEWAENGVLLLNAALTINEGREQSGNIRFHCDMWLKFLQGLLFEWIDGTSIKHKLFVMRWGFATNSTPNYAKRLWSEIDKHYVTGDFEKDIHTFEVIHHPTFPLGQENNFLTKVPEHFKEINSHYKKIFDTTDAVTLSMSNLRVTHQRRTNNDIP